MKIHQESDMWMRAIKYSEENYPGFIKDDLETVISIMLKPATS